MKLKLPLKKDRHFPIVRVDDRLLHGQVVVGWGQPLKLAPVILVSDRVAGDETLSRIFYDLVPEEQEGRVLRLAEAAELWKQREFDNRRAMLVLESLTDARALMKTGVSLKQLQLGGLHYREGRREWLPYIFLSEEDCAILSELHQNGVTIECQDLPASKPVPYEDLTLR